MKSDDLKQEIEVNVRERIKETAQALFRLKGFDNTTANDLIEELQMSEQLFRRHFQSMDELLEAVWSES